MSKLYIRIANICEVLLCGSMCCGISYKRIDNTGWNNLFKLWENLSYSTSKLDQASKSPPPPQKNRSLRCEVTKFYCTVYKYSFYWYFYSALTKISQVSNMKRSIYLTSTYIISLAFKQMGRNLNFITWVYKKMYYLKRKKIKLWTNSILWQI